ncbi:calcium-translocating P-type ATPase, PMCA-type [Candidatus Parabeggiatoa sp. HSG14]|uniref:calcium-translocating P-type ATPase, PMCA-type n=1 Tax=Candidatus Parabeggiatoa sp. HSG14 TaxID=3055593 RepID=UPI0025A85D1B|nr:calcium-translocating P-type ATPase, PMCA-type [Thiotrichales bacterium HSG14]
MKFIFSGLTEQEVEVARTQYGTNAITSIERETFWDKLQNNLVDPIIIILIFALGITVMLTILGYTEWYESVGIAMAVFIATFVATWAEHSNENEFQTLLEKAAMIQSKVFRNNNLVEIGINDIVVGDHILLQPGDTIPTDGVLVANHLEVNEASLTGESEPIRKKALPASASDYAITEENQVFRAALVEDGEAVMKATAVGDKTRYGETMKEIVTAEDRLSPLQQKLTVLGKHISTFGYIGATFIFIAFMMNHIFLQTDGGLSVYLTQPIGEIVNHLVTAAVLAIIVIVVAVPEGLPMMIAMVLALNMRKLLSVKVLVRKMLGIETAGSLTVLFSDKTGTLTQGKPVVEEFLTGKAEFYQKLENIPETLRNLVAYAVRNNTSAVIDTSNPDEPQMVGADRTEKAMLCFLKPLLAQKEPIQLVDTIPFNSNRKFSATQVKGEKALTLVKGASEIILENCTHFIDTDGNKVALTDKNALVTEMTGLSKRAMRLLAVAITETPINETQNLPNDLTLLGIFCLRDALRPSTYESVQLAKQAGIHLVMITGDAKETAQAIATDIGLCAEDKEAKILTSTELANMSDEQIKQILPHLYVVARAFPTDKSRLIKLAKESGWVVGMTGDGVNDAPAVKNADVGFAMGSGTEMTKESSDIVVLDDNFSSITKAILYGRTLFKSIRKFLIFQLTVNISAILVAFLGPFFGFDLPLTMTQLLWINIIMDTFAGLAFAGEIALSRYMKENPIPREESIISNDMWSSILTNGIIAAIMSMIFLKYPPIRELFSRGMPIESAEVERIFLTAFFGFFVFMHAFNTFNARTQGLNLFENLLDNKLFLGIIVLIFSIQTLFIHIGGEILRTVPLLPMEWLYMVMFAIVLIPVDLIRKLIRNKWFCNPVLTEAYH